MLQLICLLHAVHNLAKRIHAAGMSGGGGGGYVRKVVAGSDNLHGDMFQA